ncbi:MAG: alpha-glucosidase/alpha-galactosidase [Capsulimonadales bacterium]|nr:alpha-glucosidase/alpha-galactosidase [Capsulimonadales bacterium]
MPRKIAMIGAGSIGFTRRLMADILTIPEMADTHFAFTDISQHNLDMVTQLAERDIKGNNLPATITATTDRRAAIADADYVVCTIRCGGLEAFATDIDIPLKYGIDQCVGDTICAGGIMYGQRGIAAILEFCKDIREVAKPGALFLNYANPMAMLTWAANEFGGVNTVGLCHGVQGAQWQIARCTEVWARKEGMIGEDEKIGKNDIDFIFAGINHQTWCVRANWRGHDLIPMMHSLFMGHPDYPRTEKVRIDVLKRFGYYSTESNGHLSEYLPWYRKRLDQIEKWIDLSSWINGETGGYLRVCTEGRNWFETDFPNWLAQDPPKFVPEKRSEEHGSWIIEGLETGRVYRGHFNVVNKGHITNLPDGCIIEVPGYVDRNGINIPTVGDLPLGCAATCSASVRVQEMAVKAAVHGDVDLLKLAMLHDPLVGAVCDPEEVWQMTDEMLIAGEKWLPQYAANGSIEAAKKRLAEAEANGTRVKTMEGFQGMARLHTKSVEEMQAQRDEARANAQAADKGKMTKNA